MIKLLIVDDSALMRRQLASVFEEAGDFEILLARNGLDAVEQNRQFKPDVVTLDINMPEMDGITALSLIMAERPVPVIMVSSLTEKGALATFESMNLGAVDYVAKPGGTISLTLDQVRDELLTKVRAAARAKVPASRSSQSVAPAPAERQAKPGLRQRMQEEREALMRASNVAKPVGEGLVIIGVSTGGPRALEKMLPLLPAHFPWPVLISQHMPGTFTAPFAARLNGLCPLEVVEASKPMTVEKGKVYIGKGGADMVLARRAGVLTVLPRPENGQFLWHPSVELMARTALEHVPAQQIVGVMLTGMGNDGADGFTAIKNAGGRTIAESEETAVVFGMPAVLIQRGGATVVRPLDEVAAQLNEWAQCGAKE